MSITHIKVSSPEELLDVIPYLLGFHPEESLVFAAIVNGSVAGVARIDIADALTGKGNSLIAPFVAQVGTCEGLYIAYSKDPIQAEDALKIFTRIPAPSIAEIIISDGSWKDIKWPEMAAWYPYRPGSTRISAEAVGIGAQARRSRADLVAFFNRPKGLKQIKENSINLAAGRLAEKSPEQCYERMGRLLDKTLSGDGQSVIPLKTQEIAEIIYLFSIGRARDAFWFRLNRHNAERLLDVMLYIFHKAPNMMYATDALAAVGLCGWQSGNGAMVTIALDIPGAEKWHSMYRVLNSIHDSAAHPNLLREIVSLMEG